jgi:VanZ family protein
VRRPLAWLLAAGYCAVIFYLSSLQQPLPELTAHVWDKALHATEYGGLGALLALALGVWDEPEKGWRVALAIAIGAAYGITDETHQYFVPGRDAEVGDALADAIGTSLGASGFWTVATWRSKRASALGAQIDEGASRNSG